MESISALPENPRPFSGAKLMLFAGSRLVVLLRDNRSDIPFPNCWDFPGGGREGNETPQACVLRETWEETGLRLSEDGLTWSRSFSGSADETWMFAAHIPESAGSDLRLGHEGQSLSLMDPQDYIAHPRHVPHFAMRLQMYMHESGMVS